jgi:hypothetical protein
VIGRHAKAPGRSGAAPFAGPETVVVVAIAAEAPAATRLILPLLAEVGQRTARALLPVLRYPVVLLRATSVNFERSRVIVFERSEFSLHFSF